MKNLVKRAGGFIARNWFKLAILFVAMSAVVAIEGLRNIRINVYHNGTIYSNYEDVPTIDGSSLWLY